MNVFEHTNLLANFNLCPPALYYLNTVWDARCHMDYLCIPEHRLETDGAWSYYEAQHVRMTDFPQQLALPWKMVWWSSLRGWRQQHAVVEEEEEKKTPCSSCVMGSMQPGLSLHHVRRVILIICNRNEKVKVNLITSSHIWVIYTPVSISLWTLSLFK